MLHSLTGTKFHCVRRHFVVRCGCHALSRMRILCAINSPEAIKEILDCLGIPSKLPPISPVILIDSFCERRTKNEAGCGTYIGPFHIQAMLPKEFFKAVKEVLLTEKPLLDPGLDSNHGADESDGKQSSNGQISTGDKVHLIECFLL